MSDSWKEAKLSAFNQLPGDASAFVTPELLTESGDKFFVDVNQAVSILPLLANLVTFADNAHFVARKITSGEANEVNLPSNFNPLKPLDSAAGPFLRRMASVVDPVHEMLLVRIVDRFTTYLTDVLRECLRARPEVLRSSETIRLDTALAFESIEEMREFIIDRKVSELGYFGLGKLNKWLSSHLGIEGLAGFPGRTALVESLETRNCIVHSRGRIGKKYLRAIPDSSYKLDDLVKVDIWTVALAAAATTDCVEMLDNAIATKFGLPRIKLNWSKRGP